jgi:hypothetical protein
MAAKISPNWDFFSEFPVNFTQWTLWIGQRICQFKHEKIK